MKVGTKLNFKGHEGIFTVYGKDETQPNIKFARNENGEKISFIWN